MKMVQLYEIDLSDSLYGSTGLTGHHKLRSRAFADVAYSDVFWGKTDNQCSPTEQDLECNSILNWKPLQSLLHVVRNIARIMADWPQPRQRS